MKRLLCILAGLGLSLFGVIGVLVGIVALLDPVGTKMADDGDPFGTPPTTTESLLMLLAYVGLAGVGAWLTWRGGRRNVSAGDLDDARTV
jgi:hypothetical protein